MLVLMAIMIVWLGVLRPVTRGLADAKTAHIAAVDRAAGVKSGLALLRHAAPPPPRIEGPLDQLTASSAAEARLPPEGNPAAGPDPVSRPIGPTPPPPLPTLLCALSTPGLSPTSLVPPTPAHYPHSPR